MDGGAVSLLLGPALLLLVTISALLCLCGCVCVSRYDLDRSQFIDFMELKAMMEKLGEPQTHLALKAMIKEVDDDCDGQISFREVWCSCSSLPWHFSSFQTKKKRKRFMQARSPFRVIAENGQECWAGVDTWFLLLPKHVQVFKETVKDCLTDSLSHALLTSGCSQFSSLTSFDTEISDRCPCPHHSC